MRPAMYFGLVGLILITVFALSTQNVQTIGNVPLAIVKLAEKVADCSGQKIRYKDLELDCKSAVSFSDIRKLDLRADNRARSLRKTAKFVSP